MYKGLSLPHANQFMVETFVLQAVYFTAFDPCFTCEWFPCSTNHDHRSALQGAEVLRVEVQVEREGEEDDWGTGLGLEGGTDLGDELG